jgi:tetratricopeptide (TPR) repeat protein
VTYASFWLEYHLWGLDPLGYHVVNVLLHALNALFVWVILRKLGVKGAWWAAGIFALHPVHVESVAWIVEQKNVLSGFFYLGALLAYLHFLSRDADFSGRIHSPASAASPKPRRWLYCLALGLFLCSLLSKSVTSSLPLVILLLVWWMRGRLRWRDVYAVLPFLVLGIAMGLTTAWVEKYAVGAEGKEWAFSLSERCLIAGRDLWFYLGKLVWPRTLIFIYPRWQINPILWWQYLYPLGAVGVVLGLWTWRDRWGRGPFVAVLFFLITLAPALGFFDVYFFRYSFVADHFQYLASIGLISLAVSVGTVICNQAGPWRRSLGTVAAAIALLILGVSTWRQARIYQDLETLWRDTITKNPQCWMAHANLGDVFLRDGKISEAIGSYEQALRIKPDYVEVHSNLGLALAQTGRVGEAIGHYEQALRIKPNFAVAHCNLGVALTQTGRLPEAIEHLQQALRIEPGYAEAHCNLGVALAQAGRIQEAIEQEQQALRIKPGYAEAHYNLGVALARLGRLPETVAHFEQALRIQPEYAEVHCNLGLVLIQLGKTQEAMEHYEQALRLKPDFAEAHYNLGNVLARSGRIPEAIGHYEQALRDKPDYPEAQNSLAWLMATRAPPEGGDPARAVTLAERACQLTNNRVPESLDTLAVAYAAAGRFDDAIAAAQKAIGLARASGQTRMVSEIEPRLELYRAGRPYREPVTVTSPHGP